MIINIDNKMYLLGPLYDDGSTSVTEVKETPIEEIIYDKHSAYTDHGYEKVGDMGFKLVGTVLARSDYFRRTGTLDKRFYFKEVGDSFRAVIFKDANSNYSMTKIS